MASKVKNRLNTRLAIFAILVGIAMIAISRERSIRYFQSLKFGSTAFACVDGIGAEFGSDWLVEVISYADGTVMLYGFIPIPQRWSRHSGDSSSILLRTLGQKKLSVSVHKRDSTPIPGLRENCMKNSKCLVRKIDVGETVEVAQVQAGDVEWLTLLNSAVTVGVHRSHWDDIEGISIRACNGVMSPVPASKP